MKRILSQTALFLLLLLILFVWRFPYDTYAGKAVSFVLQKAREKGVAVNVKETDLEFPLTLRLSEVAAYLPLRPLPIPVFAEEVQIDPEFLSALLFRGVVDLQIKAYQGAIHAETDYRLLSKSLSFSFNGDNLQLSKHPLLGGFSIEGLVALRGEAELSLKKSRKLPKALLEQGSSTLHLALRDGHYAGGHTISIVKLPEVKGIELKVRVSQNKEKISCQLIEAKSSLGLAKGGGFLNIEGSGHLKNVDMDFNLDLSPEGKSFLGGYLALAAGLSPDSAPRRWKISIQKQASQPKPTFLVRPQWM